MYVLDTDHVTLYQQGQSSLSQRIGKLPPGQLATTIVTYEEQLAGRLAMVRKARTSEERIRAYFWLQRTLDFFCRIPVLAFEDSAADIFHSLIELKLRIGTQDLLIAAIAMSNQMTVLTRNRRDFERIPGLVVADWSTPL